MSVLDRLPESERADLDQVVYASYGRMVLGAPPPQGSVIITAGDRADFRRKFHELFGTGRGEGGTS